MIHRLSIFLSKFHFNVITELTLRLILNPLIIQVNLEIENSTVASWFNCFILSQTENFKQLNIHLMYPVLFS